MKIEKKKKEKRKLERKIKEGRKKYRKKKERMVDVVRTILANVAK